MKLLYCALASFALGGCSLIPYENDFACHLKDNYGKCINVPSAYDEAVTGVSKYPPMEKPSERGDHRGDDSSLAPANPELSAWSRKVHQDDGAPPAVTQGISPTPSNTAVSAATDPYSNYRGALYQKLQGLVEQPRAPMIKQPRAVRTLILPYTSTLNRDRLYMPRYVYNIVEEPQFVLGQYLTQRPQLTSSVFNAGGKNPSQQPVLETPHE